MTNPTVLFVHGALVRDGDWWWGPTAELPAVADRRRQPRPLALPSCGETADRGEVPDGGLVETPPPSAPRSTSCPQWSSWATPTVAR